MEGSGCQLPSPYSKIQPFSVHLVLCPPRTTQTPRGWQGWSKLGHQLEGLLPPHSHSLSQIQVPYDQNHPSRVIRSLLRRVGRKWVCSQPLHWPSPIPSLWTLPPTLPPALDPSPPRPLLFLNRSSFSDFLLPCGLPWEHCSPLKSHRHLPKWST